MSRWSQLTYTSFDRHDGRGGGWQVKDVTGEIGEADRRLLCGRVATQFDPGVDLPRFPTPAEVAELPHQMVHSPMRLADGQAQVTWHTAPAGLDASGRPGNVFAHVLVDRDPDPTDGIRPIERWRSHQWLVPFGAEAVLAAELGDVPGPGHIDRRTVASWLFAPRQWRTNTLAAICDALWARRADGRPVVIATEDVDEAANWIAAVSLCTSVGAASELSFTTLERASGLRHAISYGLELICVPHLDAPALLRDDSIVLIDTSDHVELGDLHGAHLSGRGDRIEVTAWSAMMLEMFADPESLVTSVERMDRAAAEVGDRDLHPAWPMAVLVSQDGDGDLRTEAMGIVAAHSPATLKGSSLYDGVIGGLRAETGSTQEAWNHVVAQGAHDDEPEEDQVLAEAAVTSYADRALADGEWLSRPGAVGLPARHLRPPTVPQAWADAAREHLASSDPVRVLHTIELALRLGLDRDDEFGRACADAAWARVVPVLIDPQQARRFAEHVESIGVETRHLLWRLLYRTHPVQQLTAPPGAVIEPAVVDLLGPAEGEPSPLVGFEPARSPQGWGVDPLLAELAMAAVARGDADEDHRFAAAWAQLERGGRTPAGHPVDWSTVGPFTLPVWSPERVLALAQRFGARVPPAWHLPHLFGMAADARWRDVWRLLQSQPDPTLAHVATVRLEQGTELGAPHLVSGQVEALAQGVTVLPITDPEALHRAHILVAAALLTGARESVPAGLEQPGDRLGPVEVRYLSDWGQRVEGGVEVIGSHRLVEVLGRRATGSPLFDPDPAPTAANDGISWLFALTAPDGDQQVPLVAALILDRVRRAGGADAVVESVRSIEALTDREIRDMQRWLSGWLRRERRREGR